MRDRPERACGKAEVKESDTIAVIEVMAESIDPDYWRSLRKRLERHLSQEETIIRAREIRRL